MTGNTTIVRSTISGSVLDNGASNYSVSGGGLAVVPDGDASVSIVDSTISYNQASLGICSPANGTGGGLFVKGASGVVSASIERSTIFANKARDGAGAYLVSFHGPVALTNTTISSNKAANAGGGAKVRSTTSTFVNDTIAFNKATSQNYDVHYIAAAGLSTYAPRIYNTIIAQNTIDTSASDSFLLGATIGSNNLIRTAFLGSAVPADTLVSDPLLDAITDNGGPTWTHALLAGSPAINAGTPCIGSTLPATDQRGPGFPRTWGAHPDIGAFESGDPASGDVIFRTGFDDAPRPS